MERRSICYAYLFVFFTKVKFDETAAADFMTSLDLKIPCVKSQVLLITSFTG